MSEAEVVETSSTPHLYAPSAVLLLLLAGCGAPAAPQPPTLNLPQPVHSLTAQRIGGTVRLTFDVPEKTTDRLPIAGSMRAEVCRAVAQAACIPVLIAPLQPATGPQRTTSIDDSLPPMLTAGPPQMLTYRVAILNSAGRSAPDPISAYTIAGATPPPVQDLAVVPQRTGIVLRWRPAVAAPGAAPNVSFVRFDRTRIGAPAGPPADRSAPPEQPEETLEVREGSTTAALDKTAHFGEIYHYTAQRFTTVTVAEHTVEVMTAPTAPVTVAYKDVFPPPVPTGLVSAVDTPGHAIDLSWSPDADPGLAGYIVYRRSGSGAPGRISPAGKPVATPAFRDTTVVPGTDYFYSVSAVDEAGNESARSDEVQDQLQP